MRRRLLALLAVLALVGAACGGSDNELADDPIPDDPGVTPDGTVPDDEPATTAPTTTDTLPPDAIEIPDLQIVNVTFGPEGFVVIHNRGDEAADLNGIQLCQFPTYIDLGEQLNGQGIGPGESVEIPAAAIGGLSIDGGEAALYSAPEFTNPDAIFAFVQWGTGGARAEVAAEAGIWPSGASVEPDPAFNSIELFGDPADPEAWS